MKRAGRRLIPLLLALVLLLGQTMTAFALWDGVRTGGGYRNHEGIISTGTGTIMQIFQLEEGESSVMPLESF